VDELAAGLVDELAAGLVDGFADPTDPLTGATNQVPFCPWPVVPPAAESPEK
jgi:hypothetical protein